MRTYLDASVLVSLLEAERHSEDAFAFVAGLAEPPVVSDFAKGEVASALSKLVRTGRLDETVAEERLRVFDEWVAEAAGDRATMPSDIRLAAQLVRRFALKLRLPDAIHLAAARASGLTLVTFDRGLANAATALGVAHVIPSP